MYEERKPQVLYICDRTKCKNCTDECHHTANKFYARDIDHEFVEIHGAMWEKPKAWDEWKLTDPRDGEGVRG